MTQEKKFEEKRRFPRAYKKIVVYHCEEEHSGNYNVTQAINFSQGGILITTDREIPEKSTIFLKLKLPILVEFLEVKGEVLQSKKSHLGDFYETRIILVELTEEAKKILAEAVAPLIKKEKSS
jgi:hypothetical protein